MTNAIAKSILAEDLPPDPQNSDLIVKMLLEDVTTGAMYPSYDEMKMRRIIASDHAIGTAYYAMKRQGMDDQSVLQQLFKTSIIPNQTQWDAYNATEQPTDTPIPAAHPMGSEEEEDRQPADNYGAGLSQGLLT